MDEIAVDEVASPDLESPVLLEGLPGVGHVGALAAGHLLEECDSELVRRVHSEHFPPQVMIEDEAVELTGTRIHAVDLDGRDALVLSGEHQPQTPTGHYRVAEAYLDVAESFGAERVLSLGGVPTGELIDEYDVLGAATDDALREEFAEIGVSFRADEPAGGIVGVSGLLLGLGARRGFASACLMGETSGYLVDPKSAAAVLEVLEEALGFEVDMGSLEERAEEMEEVMRKIQEFEDQQTQMDVPTEEDLRYIG